jgi:hypothetical protein
VISPALHHHQRNPAGVAALHRDSAGRVKEKDQLDQRKLGRLAQLVRAAGLQPAGRGFESLSAHSLSEGERETTPGATPKAGTGTGTGTPRATARTDERGASQPARGGRRQSRGQGRTPGPGSDAGAGPGRGTPGASQPARGKRTEGGDGGGDSVGPMAIFRWFVPRKVRRVMHPVGSTKRRLTPKPVRTAFYVRHPVGTATSAVTRRALRGGRRRRRR